MGKSSSDRRRSGSELSSKPARRANDEDGSSRARTDGQPMSASSRRNSGRRDPYDDDGTTMRPRRSADSRFAPVLTAEPSEISSTHRSQPTADDDWEETQPRSQKVREREKSSGQGTRRGDVGEYNDRTPTRKDSEPIRRGSRRSGKADKKSSARAYEENEASLPQNQFPGEFPATYSQPYRPPGLAAEYYGDTGESVAFQPGVRPNPPSIVTSAEQAHLMEPTLEAKPPPEPSSLGAVGAAASYFGSGEFDNGPGVHSTPAKPTQTPDSRPSRPPMYDHSGGSPRTSPGPQGNPSIQMPSIGNSFGSSAATPIGAAAGYYAGTYGDTTFTGAYETPSRPPAGASYSGSPPFSAPAGFAKPQQHSNAGLYGGAGLAGAAAGAFIDSHSHNEQQLNQHHASATHAPQRPFNGHSSHHSAHVQQVHRHRRRGPLGKLVDWFRDPDAVAEFEQYTEAIGVCKYCFDPMSSPADAPRKHHYHRSGPSPGTRYGSSTRVDKTYRYSSDEERRKHSGARKAVVGGLADYGAAKIGDAIFKSKYDFDDTQSVKSGRPLNRSRVSFQDEEVGRSHRSRRHSPPEDARVQRHDSTRKSSMTTRRRDRRSPGRRDSSPSPSSRRGSRGAAISAVTGAAALAMGAASGGKVPQRRSRSRSPSPAQKIYYSKRVSPMHSYVDLSATNTAPGGIASFFTSPSANKGKARKSKGFFNFANGSSSSTDADLAFGAATVRRKRSGRLSRDNVRRRDSNAALIGLVTTGEALAAESARRQKKGKERLYADGATGRSRKSTSQQRIPTYDDESHEGHDDGWYDTDNDDNQSSSSIDTALAYGETLSALQSRESLIQNESASQSVPGRRSSGIYPAKEEERRRHDTYAPEPTTGVSTAVGAAAAMGAWAASSGYNGRTPSSSHSDLPPLRELEPRPVSDHDLNDSRDRKTRKADPNVNYIPGTRKVSSTSVPLQQPQPVTPVAPFLHDNGFEAPTRKEYSHETQQHEPGYASHGQSQVPGSERYVEKERPRQGRRQDSNGKKRGDAVPGGMDIVHSVRDSGSKRNSTRGSAPVSFDPSDQRVSEIEQELERLYAEQKQVEARERKKRDQPANYVAETATVSPAITVKDGTRTIEKDGSPPRRKSSLKQSNERQPSSPVESQQDRIARMKARPSRSTTPSPVYENYGSFFVPKELQEHLKEHNAKAEHRDDIGATVVEIIPGATRPRKQHSFDPDTYRPFGLDLEDDPSQFPWPVPLLSLIEPTPPGSQAHSIQGDASPVIQPAHTPESSESKSATGSKVTWGEHDTYVYEVATPEYEQSDYIPRAATEEEKRDDPVPDTNEETVSVEDFGGDVPKRPSVSRVWTLDEAEAEELEKEVPVVDDMPQISRAWTVDDSEADQIEHDTSDVRQDKQQRDKETSHIIEVDPDHSQIHGDDHQPFDEKENVVGDTATLRSEEDTTPPSIYRSPFAETVSDLGMSLDSQDREDLRSSPAVRASKRAGRRLERADSSNEEVRTFADLSSKEVLDGLNEEAIPEPEVPGNESVFDYLLNEKEGKAVPHPSKLAMGAVAVATFAQDEVAPQSKPLTPDSFDDTVEQPRLDSKEHYQSDPEDWERSTGGKRSKKKSKRASRSDAGVDDKKSRRSAEGQSAIDEEELKTPTRSLTLDDISELRDSTATGSESRKSKRKSKRNGAEPTEVSHDPKSRADEADEGLPSRRQRLSSRDEDDSRSVASTSISSENKSEKRPGGFFSSIFSSNKSDVSTSSKKNSKSAKSNDRADGNDDQLQSRKKRSSKDKDSDDKPGRRSRSGSDFAATRDDEALSSRDQSVDNGFVSAEDNNDAIVKSREDDESFLATRPEMPLPTVMDMPMETDGVSGPISENKPSDVSGSALEGSLESQREPANEVSEHETPVELEHTKSVPESPENIPSEEQARVPEVDISTPQQTLPQATPHHGSSRRLSAIRTAEMPSSPIVTGSPTAVPLHFRRPPPSPTTGRFSMSSPIDLPSSPLTTPRTRQGRPKSTEFRASTEFRPLYLVERQNYAKTATPEAVEDYPSLPSSKTSSAHASTEDLRGDALAQEHDYTPSRINAEMFRERGRRHSYSYWHDEKRRASPDYLDSRSATPVPGDAQRAREHERRSKPKYEFHSPSELLQDPSTYQEVPSTYQEVPSTEWDDGLASPLPSILSGDQDYMSARSRSLSPTRTRSVSQGRMSRSMSRSTSADWQDALPAIGAGALAGSLAGMVTYGSGKSAEKKSSITDINATPHSAANLPKAAQEPLEDVSYEEKPVRFDATSFTAPAIPEQDRAQGPADVDTDSVTKLEKNDQAAAESADGAVAPVWPDQNESTEPEGPLTNLSDLGTSTSSPERPHSAVERRPDVEPDIPSHLTAQAEPAPTVEAGTGAAAVPGGNLNTSTNDSPDTITEFDAEAIREAAISEPVTSADDDFQTPQGDAPVKQSDGSPFEQAFEAALQARGLGENSTVEDALHELQANVAEPQSGSPLTTIDEVSELPTPATEEQMDNIDGGAKIGRKMSKKEKRKARKESNPSFNADDTADVSADQQQPPEVTRTGGKPPEFDVSNVDVTGDASEGLKEQLSSSENTLDTALNSQQDDPGTTIAGNAVDFESQNVQSDLEAGRRSSGPSVEVPSRSNARTVEDDWLGAVKTSKKDKKGKKSKRKQASQWEDDEPSAHTTESGPAETSRDLGTTGTVVLDSSSADTSRGESHFQSIDPAAVEREKNPEVAPTAVLDMEEATGTDTWDRSTKKGKKKSKKKSLMWTDDADPVSYAETSNAVVPAAAPEVSQKEGDGASTQQGDPVLGGTVAEEPVTFAPSDTADTRDFGESSPFVPDANIVGAEGVSEPSTQDEPAQQPPQDQQAENDWEFTPTRSTKKKDKKKRTSKVAAEGTSLSGYDEDPGRPAAEEGQFARGAVEASAEDIQTPTIAADASAVEQSVTQESSGADYNLRDLGSANTPEQLSQSNTEANEQQELLPVEKLDEQKDGAEVTDTSLSDKVGDHQQPANSSGDAERQADSRNDATAPIPQHVRDIQTLKSEGLATPPALGEAIEDNESMGPPASAVADLEDPANAREVLSAVEGNETGPQAPSQFESKDAEEDFGFSFKPAKTKKEKKGRKKRATLLGDLEETPGEIVHDKSTGPQASVSPADVVAPPTTEELEPFVRPAEEPTESTSTTQEAALENADPDNEFPMMTRKKSKKEKRKKRYSVLDMDASEPAAASYQDQTTSNNLEAKGGDHDHGTSEAVSAIISAEKMGEHHSAVDDALADRIDQTGGEPSTVEDSSAQERALDVPLAEGNAAQALPVEVPLPVTPAEEVPAEDNAAEVPLPVSATREMPAEGNVSEPLTVEVPLPESPTREMPAEEASTDESSSILGSAVKGITGVMASAMKSIASVAPPTVVPPAAETPADETPAIENPAVETPAIETPAVETPAVETSTEETPAVETPAVETPTEETQAVETFAAELDVPTPPKTSATTTDDGWDLPRKESKKEKKKRRQNALNSVLAEPQQLAGDKQLATTPADNENRDDVEIEHPRDVVPDPPPYPKDVLDDDWGVTTKKTNKEKKKKRQPTLDTPIPQEEASPDYGVETQPDGKALLAEDVQQATSDSTTEERTATEASKPVDRMLETVPVDDQGDDLFAFTSKKSKKDKKKKRQSGLATAADAYLGYLAQNVDHPSQSPKDDSIATELEDDIQQAAISTPVETNADEDWGFTTTKSKDKKKKRKSKMDEVTTSADEHALRQAQDDVDPAVIVGGVEDSLPVETSVPVQESYPWGEPVSFPEPAAEAGGTTVDKHYPIEKALPFEEPMHARDTVPAGQSMSTEETTPAEDSALLKDAMPAEQPGFDAGVDNTSQRQTEPDVQTTERHLEMEQDEHNGVADPGEAKNVQGDADADYNYKPPGELQEAETSAPLLTQDIPKQTSSPLVEHDPPKENPVLPGLQMEDESQAPDDEWALPVKKSKKDKKKKRQAAFADHVVEPQSIDTELQRSNQEVWEPSTQAQNADVTTAAVENDASHADVGPVEEEAWSMSKKSKKDKKKKKRQQTLDDSFVEEQSPSVGIISTEAPFSANDANGRQPRDRDAPLTTDTASVQEPPTSWTSISQPIEDKEEEREGEGPYVDMESKDPEMFVSGTTQPEDQADIVSSEHSPRDEDNLHESGLGQRDEAAEFSKARHHFDTTVPSGSTEHVTSPNVLNAVDDFNPRGKEISVTVPSQDTISGGDRGQDKAIDGPALVQEDNALVAEPSAASVTTGRERVLSPKSVEMDTEENRQDWPTESPAEPEVEVHPEVEARTRDQRSTEDKDPVNATIIESQMADEWSTPSKKPKKGKKKNRQSTLQESLGEPEAPQITQAVFPAEEPARKMSLRSALPMGAEPSVPEFTAEQPRSENAEPLPALKDITLEPERRDDDTIADQTSTTRPEHVGPAETIYDTEKLAPAKGDVSESRRRSDLSHATERDATPEKTEDAENKTYTAVSGKGRDISDDTRATVSVHKADPVLETEPGADSDAFATRQAQPPATEEDWGFPTKKSKKKTKKLKSRFSYSEQDTPESEAPRIIEQDATQAYAPHTTSPEPIQEVKAELQSPATPAEAAPEDYFVPIGRKKSKKDKKKKSLPAWTENDEEFNDKAPEDIRPTHQTQRDDEVVGDRTDEVVQRKLPGDDTINGGKPTKKGHRLFEFSGTEPSIHPSAKVNDDSADDRTPMDAESATDQPTQAPDMDLPQEDVENMSDVSASTRERRKRRRSPPAWSGEEPQDLPSNRALTPPPEHDDMMDTALGVAAGLGIGAAGDAAVREVTSKPTSPARQLSAKWSFARLGRLPDHAQAVRNRDSGVQLDSPLLAQGQTSSARDSGFVPDPADEHDRPYRSREIDPAMDVSLRPPRPQSPTSSTEDVSQTVSSKGHRSEERVLETPRKKPSPVAATSKDRSSALFNSSPAFPTPIDTKFVTQDSAQANTPLRRSPSIHGHHHSREQLRQLARASNEPEYSDQLASNLIDRSAKAHVNPSTYDVVTQDRPFSPRTSLDAIYEEPEAGRLVAGAGMVGLAAAGAVSSRPRDLGPAKSLGTSKSRTSSLRNLRGDSTSPFDADRLVSSSSRDLVDDNGFGSAATRDRDMAEVYVSSPAISHGRIDAFPSLTRSVHRMAMALSPAAPSLPRGRKASDADKVCSRSGTWRPGSTNSPMKTVL